MTANDPIIVSPQNRQEQSGLDELRRYLRPWRCTFVDQRDDFGRDGFVQIVDVNDDGINSISPLTFGLQCKTDAKGFSEKSTDSVETRHLGLWSHEFASPTVLAMWSVADNEFRFRSARDVAAELDRTNPAWRNQGFVSIQYRPHHGYATPGEARAGIRRMVRHELDRRGGVETYHSAKRRVVLTTLLPLGTASTSQTLTLSGENETKLVVGEGWVNGDLDPYEVVTEHVLTSSLLLYEEVWIPFRCLGICLKLLGEQLVLDLLDRNRLRPYMANRALGFHYNSDALTGRLMAFDVHEEDPRNAPATKSLSAMLRDVVGPDQGVLIKRLQTTIVAPPNVDSLRVCGETLADLRKPNIRSLLGLRPRITEEEPYWDAQLVNRLASINLSFSIASAIRADVVQFESGLSRLSSEKHFHSFGLDRHFASAKVFDSILRSTGIPDLGQLTQRTPLIDLCSLSDTTHAQDFRDWFWETAATLLCTGGSITQAFLRQVESLLKDDLKAYSLPVQLKMRYVNRFDWQYHAESTSEHTPAFATTCSNGDEASFRQRRNWSTHRLNVIREAGFSPRPYDKCPCRSGDKFRFCCGRPISIL